MARKTRAKRNKFARAVPGNTMTITLPIEDTITASLTGGYKADVGRCAYDWKTVTIGDLLKKFPLYANTGSSLADATLVPEAYKVSSVGVASGAGVPVNGKVYPANLGDTGDFPSYPVGAAVKFVNGQLFEQSSGSSRTMKCKPSDVPTYGPGNNSVICGTWVRLSGSSLTSTSPLFSYKGELKYVTISFRLPDNADLAN